MRRLLLTTAIAGAALLLTGCHPTPAYSPPPTPTVEPFFPTEEDALTATEALMTEYVAALNVYIDTDGEDADALEPLLSEQQFADEEDVLQILRDRQLSPQGHVGYFGLEIQQFRQESVGWATIQAYVCMDYRSSSYVRADGSRYEGEAEWAPFEALIDAKSSTDLTLSELRYWTGRDFCEVFL